MKTFQSLLGIALFSLLSVDVASAQTAPASPEPTYPHFLEKSGVQILSATYGSGTRFSDVTDVTIRLLNQQSRFYARPEWLDTDPTPGWNKALVIVFTYQNHRYLFSRGEGGEVSTLLLQRLVDDKAAAAHS